MRFLNSSARFLGVSTLAVLGFALPALACPNVRGDPSYGDVSLSAGFSPDPHRVSLSAGGPTSAASCISGTEGYVADNPDVDFYFSGSTNSLTFSVTSGADTVLIINTPGGSWLYSDDASGIDPSIRVQNPSEGLYNIWVGTHSPSNAYPDATLLISEF